ncbi:MAG TPA: hypothetical protein VGL82_11175 [Bryobacteraceae bacterium]|jgi:hypothetical protein
MISALLMLSGSFFAQQQIPEPATLVKEIEAHQRHMDDIRENYTFHEITITDDVASDGKVRNTASEEREIFFVNGYRLARLVKKNGNDLTEAERRHEQERIAKMVEIRMKQSRAHAWNRRGENAGMSQILRLMKISNPRRIVLNDRSTLAYDFVGDPHSKAHGLAENAARRITGTVWIDETDREVARLEAKFDDTFRIGGGFLASIHKGTSLTFEQLRLDQGLWMQTVSEIHLTARELLVRGVRQDIHIKDSDFRRFDVGTLQQFAPPSQ